MRLPILLCFCLDFAVIAAPAALESPLDYEVFQRQAPGSGAIRIKGSTDAAADHWEYQVSGTGVDPGSDESWHDFTREVHEGAFDFPAKVEAGGWHRVVVRGLKSGQTVAELAVEHVGVGEVFVIAGQSNAGSYGSEKQQTKSGLVASWNGKQWAPANDPQRGGGGEGGSFMPAFGDAMAVRFHVAVGLVPLAAGGTSVREWLPKGVRFKELTTTGHGVVKAGDGYESNGGLFERLAKAVRAPGDHGFRAVLWHQGESDAGQARSGYPAERQISGAEYFDFMSKLIAASREKAGWAVPWFTAQATYHSEKDPGDDEFRAAQKKLWEAGISLQGPDTDSLRAEWRAGVHFNGQGLRKHGEMWAEKVGDWLEGQARK